MGEADLAAIAAQKSKEKTAQKLHRDQACYEHHRLKNDIAAYIRRLTICQCVFAPNATICKTPAASNQQADTEQQCDFHLEKLDYFSRELRVVANFREFCNF